MNIKIIEDINKPAVLVFHLSEFFQGFGMPDIKFSETVYNSPFYIYDTSLEGEGPAFEDEEDISDEDCDAGFAIIREIWTEYVGRAYTPAFKYIFKIMKDPEDNGSLVGSMYGFAPGYTMDSAIKTITEQGFEVFSWDEFWNRQLILTTDGDSGISGKENEDSKYVRLLLTIDKETYMGKTSFGGLPVKDRNSSFEWPKCHCGTEMQYQCKIKTDLGLEMIFIPNCGHEVDNKVVIIDSENLEFVYPEENQKEQKEAQYVADSNRYKISPVHHHNVFGLISRYSRLIKQDNNPKCDCCGKEMRLIARFESNFGIETPMTDRDEYSYLFDCEFGKTAKFLTQYQLN